MPGEDRPWLFPTIPSIHDETIIPTPRRSESENPMEYRFSALQLAQWIVSRLNIPTNVNTPEGFVQDFTNHQTNTLVWTENGGSIPSNPEAFFFVLENGKKLKDTVEYVIDENTAPGESTITIINPIPGASYELIAWFF